MSNYTPNPLAVCESPTPCPDPCATQAYILGRQTQALSCVPEPTPDSDSILEGLVAYWSMDGGAGGAGDDSHTGNHDLSLTFVSAVPGILSNGIHLSGSPGGHMDNSDAVFGFTTAYTVAGWVYNRLNIAGLGAYLIGKQDKWLGSSGGFPTEGWMLYINSGGVFSHWHGNGTSAVEVSDPLGFNNNEWIFIVCGFSGTAQFIQVNSGTRNMALALTPTVGPRPLQFGEVKGPSNPNQLIGPDAYFDEFGIWNRVLTLAEVEYLYNSGVGRTYPFT